MLDSATIMRYQTFVFLTSLVATAGMASPVQADVLRTGPGGVIVRTTVEVNAAPEVVYDALTARVGEWWGATNTWSGDARNLSVDARAGGCFCEKLSSGGTVQHMQVVWAERGTLLRLSGAPGRLQEGAFIGTLSWALTKTAVGTRIEMTFSVAGFAPGGFEAIAPAVDESWSAQVGRLAKYLGPAKP